MSGQLAEPSRTLDAFVTCRYTGDPDRPDCEHRAVVAYGRIALCAYCTTRRSTVGKGMVGRTLVQGRSWTALLAVEAAVDRLRAAEAELTDAVAEARSKGHSWGELGRSIGVSRQAAQQRFSQTSRDLGGSH